jgi:hypothetical protein
MFESAKLKIGRADHHIRDLERQLSIFVTENLDGILTYTDVKAGDIMVTI